MTYTATDNTDNLPITGENVTVTFTTPTSSSATTTATTTSRLDRDDDSRLDSDEHGRLDELPAVDGRRGRDRECLFGSAGVDRDAVVAALAFRVRPLAAPGRIVRSAALAYRDVKGGVR